MIFGAKIVINSNFRSHAFWSSRLSNRTPFRPHAFQIARLSDRTPFKSHAFQTARLSDRPPIRSHPLQIQRFLDFLIIFKADDLGLFSRWPAPLLDIICRPIPRSHCCWPLCGLSTSRCGTRFNDKTAFQKLLATMKMQNYQLLLGH